MDRPAAGVVVLNRSRNLRAPRSLPRRTKLHADLRKNLGGNLVWAIASWQPNQRLVMALAEMADLAKTMARPADGEENQGDIGADDHWFECFDRLVLLGLDPEQRIEPERSLERLLGLAPADAADQDDAPAAQQSRHLLHLGCRLVVDRCLDREGTRRQKPIDLPENQSEATRRIVHIRDDVDDRH